jgi:hypothetical protein
VPTLRICLLRYTSRTTITEVTSAPMKKLNTEPALQTLGSLISIAGCLIVFFCLR